ncbi:MAG TPA: TIGR03790 family protein [Candidatus Acidoferrum sp.]|jgi:uncharacterized protein (TIGR03790 family)|nr:TIGR03790 family protein [Candidatus Acidoferrum sp.]
MKALFAVLTLVWLLAAASVSASEAGDEAIVIYNSRMPESREVAEYYARRRQVPTNQVFGFALSTNEVMSRAEFRDDLQRPLAKALEKEKLWHIAARIVAPTNHLPGRVDWVVVSAKIRYAALCYGVPLKIESDPTLKEEGAEKLRPEMRRNEAAVDSELALLPLIEQKLPLNGPLRNPSYASTNAALLQPVSGVLLVSRLDGPSAVVARGLVDKALQAEADGLWGRAYIDVRNTTDPGYKIGDDNIRNAGEICRRLGFETVVDDNPDTFPAGFPLSQIAIYIGWYSPDACGPFAQPTVEFMPGAFAYHLHSYSAETLRSTTKGWVGPLVAKGATITMGCVYEPYLTGTPDTAVFTSRLVYYGFTFGEAAYASQPVLSWQTTVVGDPLYRPFGKNPEQVQDEIEHSHGRRLEWAWLRLVDLNLANGKSSSDCAALLEGLALTKQSAVLSEKLGDLCATQGKPSSAVHAWEQALKLEPSPQQRVRLLLGLGERLLAQDRAAESYDAYQRLLQECPGYPDKASVYQKLLPLAEKLGKTVDAAKYRETIGSGAK